MGPNTRLENLCCEVTWVWHYQRVWLFKGKGLGIYERELVEGLDLGSGLLVPCPYLVWMRIVCGNLRGD